MSPNAYPSARADVSSASLAWIGRTWFVIALIGQTAFLAFILIFYGARTLTGDFAGWNDKPLIDGHIEGDGLGNVVFAVHVLIASLVTLCGLLQLMPQLRSRWPRVHRWTGRVYLVISTLTALTGVWLTVVRGTSLSTVSDVAILINAMLILVFAGLTWREALRRRFEAHRRWAMRTFMVVSGVWFLRVGIMGWIVLNRGPVGMDGSLSGPADIGLVFGSYLIPLAVLEIYLVARRGRSRVVRWIATALMTGACLYTAAGVFGAVAFMWAPYL